MLGLKLKLPAPVAAPKKKEGLLGSKLKLPAPVPRVGACRVKIEFHLKGGRLAKLE